MKFSHDGKFLASAGQDAMVYVWEVSSHRGEPPPAEQNGIQQEAKDPAAPATSSPTAGNPGQGSPVPRTSRIPRLTCHLCLFGSTFGQGPDHGGPGNTRVLTLYKSRQPYKHTMYRPRAHDEFICVGTGILARAV
jgi:hypothetical protein